MLICYLKLKTLKNDNKSQISANYKNLTPIYFKETDKAFNFCLNLILREPEAVDSYVGHPVFLFLLLTIF